jgi:hypothetical protein
MNYWVYFNSKPVPKPADVLIFDDAHLAEQPLSSLQTLRIPDKKGRRESSTVKPAASSSPTPGRAMGGSRDVASADAEVSAATNLWVGDHAASAKAAAEAAALLADAGETEQAAFWRYVEAHALFDRGRNNDLAAARAAPEDATTNGPRTTWFRRLSRTVDELAGGGRSARRQHACRAYTDGIAPERHVRLWLASAVGSNVKAKHSHIEVGGGVEIGREDLEA